MPARRALSMVELIVVLSIIGVLLGLLLPAVQIVRERARETVCKNNIYQTNLATVNFLETHKKLPGPSRPGRIGGWMFDILPFIEQQNLNVKSPVGAPITDAPQDLLRPPMIFRCPRSTTLDSTPDNSMWRAHYVFVPMGKRESFLIYDAPVDLKIPWANGAEMKYHTILASKGPHHDGFFFTNGSQQGIGFMLDGKELR